MLNRLRALSVALICFLLFSDCNRGKETFTCFVVKSNVNYPARIWVTHKSVRTGIPLDPLGSQSLKCTDQIGKGKYAPFTYIDGLYDSLVVEAYVKHNQGDTLIYFDTLRTYKDYRLEQYWLFTGSDPYRGNYTLTISQGDLQ